MTLEELEQTIAQYLKLSDPGIIKLLAATVIANRLPKLDSTWLFVVSSSSGGKSELLLALSYARGMMQKDDMTAKTFISGAKGSGGAETSLIYRLPDDAIMVIKDLTVLLTKDEREADAIFSQLRMIYDGGYSKSFGTGQDIEAKVRMGLIAGTTSEIEDHQTEEAAVGQRAIKYYMKQPPDEQIDEVTENVLAGKQDKAMREVMGLAFRAYLDENNWTEGGVEIPELPTKIIKDLSALSNMATLARSSIKRKQYSMNNPIVRKNLREMPFRFAKQLSNLARAMMILNRGELTGLDKRILYQIALDSIPSARKEVLLQLTGRAHTLKELAQAVRLPEDSVKIHVDDLVALDMVTRERGYTDGLVYHLKDKHRNLISVFEDIPMVNEVVPEVPVAEEPVADYNLGF